MEFPRHTRPLYRPRPLPQPPQQKNVINRRPHLIQQLPQKTQLFFAARKIPRIIQQYPPRPLFAECKIYARHRFRAGLLRQPLRKISRQRPHPFAPTVNPRRRPRAPVRFRIPNRRRGFKKILLTVQHRSVEPMELTPALQHSGEHAKSLRLQRRNPYIPRLVQFADVAQHRLQSRRHPRFDPRLPQHRSDHGFFRPQPFLLFAQVSQQQRHHQQRNRPLKQMAGVQLQRHHSQQMQMRY